MIKIDRTFIEVPIFTKNWFSLGFTDDDLVKLQNILLEDPKSGDMMIGTGGLRKLRFAIEGKGKSGGARVCYVDFAFYGVIYLINVYSKNEKDNLTNEEKNNVKMLLKRLKDDTKNLK